MRSYTCDDFCSGWRTFKSHAFLFGLTLFLNACGPLAFWSGEHAQQSGGTTDAAIVGAGNHAPIANADSASLGQDSFVVINVVANDTDADLGDTISVIAVASPAHGSNAINDDGTIRYTPDSGYAGADTFNYTLSDATGTTSQGSVTITVNANHAPTISTYIAPAFNEDTQSIITLPYSDVDGDLATSCAIFNLNKVNETQSCVCAGGVCTVGVRGKANLSGGDWLNYTVTANGQTSQTATVILTITPVNDAPVASDYSITLPYFTTSEITLPGSDVDVGASLVYTIVDAPDWEYGNLVVNDASAGIFSFEAGTTSGTVSFTYQIYDAVDNSVFSDVKTVSLTIRKPMFFCDPGNQYWNDPFNWFWKSDCTDPAYRVPENDDYVTIRAGDNFTDTPDPVSLVAYIGQLPMQDTSNTAGIKIKAGGVLHVTGDGVESCWEGTTELGASVNFENGAVNKGTIISDASFNHSINWGVVNGKGVFENFSENRSTVNGGARFTDSDNASGAAVLGTVEFYNTGGNTGANNGMISSDALKSEKVTFNGDTYNTGQITGPVIFNDFSDNYTTTGFCFGGPVTFNGSATNASGSQLGDSECIDTVIFNGGSSNHGTINLDASAPTVLFKDSSYSDGAINYILTAF